MGPYHKVVYTFYDETGAIISFLLVLVVVAEIEPSLDISEIVQTLNKVAHDVSLRHLKRVSKRDGQSGRVIIGKTDCITPEDIDRCRQLGLKNFETVSVPANQPWTRAQYNECKNIWPVNFHEEKL